MSIASSSRVQSYFESVLKQLNISREVWKSYPNVIESIDKLIKEIEAHKNEWY